MKRQYRTSEAFAPPVGLMVVIFLLSSIPGRLHDSRLAFLTEIDPQLQNLLHVPLFGLLQVLWLYSFMKLGRSGWVRMFACLFISMFYGIFDELHQLFVPGRYASLLDMILNFTGIFLGTLLFLFWEKKNASSAIL